MKVLAKGLFVAAIVAAAPLPASAQVPQADVAFGYTIFRASSEGESVTLPKGWAVAVSKGVRPGISVVGEAGGNYRSETEFGQTFSLSTHAFLAGVRLVGSSESQTRPFGQVLAGIGTVSASDLDEGASGFSFQIGAGVDLVVSESYRLRLQADLPFRRFSEFGESSTVKGIRFLVGIAIPFGEE